MTGIAVPSVVSLTAAGVWGARVSAGASVLGLVFGTTWWAFGVLGGDPLGIAWGYAAGIGISAVLPIVVVWRRRACSWVWLSVRVGVAGAGFAALLQGADVNGSTARLVAESAGFLAAWTVASGGDVRVLFGRQYAATRRSRRSSST